MFVCRRRPICATTRADDPSALGWRVPRDAIERAPLAAPLGVITVKIVVVASASALLSFARLVVFVYVSGGFV